MKIIAVLGTGHMGTPIARRLLAGGNRVRVWNRSPERSEPLAAVGATVAASPSAAVDGAEVVVVMLADAGAVETVLFGPDGAATALRPGTVVVQMSTIGPDEVRAVAGRLPAGVYLLDAPVGGSVNAARAGTLVIFAGGPADAVERAAPVLGQLGTVRHCGPIGAGAAVKLVANTGLVTAVAALHDALAVAAALGVDRQAALDVLDRGALGGAVGRATAPGASFAVTMAAKDARLALRRPVPAPVLEAALDLMRAAPDQDADLSSLVSPDFCEGTLMRLTLDNPESVAAPFGDRFAHVARIDVGGGALLMLAGQVAVDDDGEVVAPGDAGAQAERIFEIVGGVLAAHGASFDDVLHVRTFMTDLADLPAYAAVRRRLFPGTPPPASTTVEISKLFLPGAVLEVEVTAVVRSR
ncbi:NAD(P)-binding domain-containing protein [Micromonospora chalcea]|uniref:NAD(P)-binding domain-containing protein n=1 Tax=Micromonospora chalcea TaxID=1874 RepID=UPI0033E62003